MVRWPGVNATLWAAVSTRASWPSVLSCTCSVCALPERFDRSSARLVWSPPARKRGAESSAIKGAAITVLASAMP
ncbi:hypothetical protein D3C81_2262620 [compost metagenome]